MSPKLPTPQPSVSVRKAASLMVCPCGDGSSQHQPSLLQKTGMAPQTFGVPRPPHVCAGVHAPQSMKPPQPSSTWPQLAAAASQVVGVQPQACALGPPPHVSGAAQ